MLSKQPTCNTCGKAGCVSISISFNFFYRLLREWNISNVTENWHVGHNFLCMKFRHSNGIRRRGTLLKLQNLYTFSCFLVYVRSLSHRLLPRNLFESMNINKLVVINNFVVILESFLSFISQLQQCKVRVNVRISVWFSSFDHFLSRVSARRHKSRLFPASPISTYRLSLFYVLQHVDISFEVEKNKVTDGGIVRQLQSALVRFNLRCHDPMVI